MNNKQAVHALALTGLGAAAGIAWLATRSAGPVKLTQYTECRQGTIQEHLVTAAELLGEPARVRHHYPVRVAPAITDLISHGFAPLYCPPDAQIAALPAEESW